MEDTMRLIPIDGNFKNRRYYTSDLRFAVHYGQRGWKVVDLKKESTVYVATILEVKQYLRGQR